MDPVQAMHNLIIAIQGGDRDMALEVVEDLIDWVERDGYLPLVQINGVAA
jgi:hypothetical protein